MAKSKLQLRVDPRIFDAVEKQAEAHQLSISELCEEVLRNYCFGAGLLPRDMTPYVSGHGKYDKTSPLYNPSPRTDRRRPKAPKVRPNRAVQSDAQSEVQADV